MHRASFHGMPLNCVKTHRVAVCSHRGLSVAHSLRLEAKDMLEQELDMT